MSKVIFAATLLGLTFNCLAQDYTYDATGKLSKDNDKKIRSIHYNHLDLADTIVFEDGRKIIYMYTAIGQKLLERVIDAGGRIVKRADYSGGLLYNNDSLRQIRQGNGRVVPILVGNLASPWEYQYDQKDHLGNVRTLLTSRQDIDNSQATLETAGIETEQNQFQRYEDARRINSTLFDHTRNGTTSFSQRLNGSPSEKYGLARSLSVMPGDVVTLEAFAKYADPDVSHWLPLLADLMTNIATGAVGTVVDGTGYSTNGNTPFPFVGLNGTANNTDPGPKSYLNWLVFDRSYNFKTGGYIKINANAKENGGGVEHDHLSKQLTIKEPGFVYVYLSNEEISPVDVFFDDFSVELVKGPIIQQTDYDPFGLVMNEASREHAEPNNFLYNSKELQKDFDLNWYDFGMRMYDPALGRWHVADPKAEKYHDWSPYNYVLNNPVAFLDPDGQDVRVSKAFSNSLFGPIFRDLYKNNIEYRTLLKNYEGRKGTLILDMGEYPEVPDANAYTECYFTRRPSSGQFYSKKNIEPTSVWDDRVTYKLTEIAMASIIIHEAIHSKMGAEGEKEDEDHNRFNKYHEQFVTALKAYNDAHDLGYTDAQLEDVAYNSTGSSSDFSWYILKIAQKNGTTFDKESENFTNRMWTQLYFTVKEDKRIQETTPPK